MLISAILIVGSLFLAEKSIDKYVFAQSEDKVSIEFNAAQFFPETEDNNLLEIVLDYKTNDPSLIDSTINGVMQVFAPNGTLLKVSSYPNGIGITDSGKIPFKTSFIDDSLNSVTANLTLTDLAKTETISNTVETTIPFNNDEDLKPMITSQGLRNTNSNNENQDIENTDEIKGIISTSNPDLTINSVSSFFRSDSFNIVGEVMNQSDETKESVKLSVTLYDSSGKVIGTDYTFADPSDISSEDSAPFSVYITDSDVSDLDSISSYKIQVSSL
jgi:hypothetical protein